MKDIMGRELKPNTWCVYAGLSGRSADLRVGYIQEIDYTKEKVKLQGFYNWSWRNGWDKNSRISHVSHLDNIMMVEEFQIPLEVRNLL